VDRWRYLNYQSVVDDPLLRTLCITDHQSTRFHSCERYNQCAAIQAAFTPGSGKRVVTIEFIEEKAVEHAIKMQEVQKECLLAMQGKGNWPTKLVRMQLLHNPSWMLNLPDSTVLWHVMRRYRNYRRFLICFGQKQCRQTPYCHF
jgi:hypothetical protein